MMEKKRGTVAELGGAPKRKPTKTIILIFFALAILHTPFFISEAAACGGWWDPCCPWYDPDRCAAFDANKRQKAAENEQYFARQEERLRNLADIASWLPAGGYAQKALSAAARAAKAAKEANAAVARGGSSGPSDYADYTDFEYVNRLNDSVYSLVNYGNYTAGESRTYTACMQETGEYWEYCQRYYWTANWGISIFGWLHGEMAYDMEVIAWQLEYYEGYDWPYSDISYYLRDMARQSYEARGAFQ